MRGRGMPSPFRRRAQRPVARAHRGRPSDGCLRRDAFRLPISAPLLERAAGMYHVRARISSWFARGRRGSSPKRRPPIIHPLKAEAPAVAPSVRGKDRES